MAIIRLNNRSDTFTDKPTTNIIYGRAGDDRISGNGGNDDVYGEDGNDTIRVDAPGPDSSGAGSGGNGNDNIDIFAAYASAIGGPGKDTLRITSEFGYAYGGDGTDTIRVGGPLGRAYGEAGDDRLVAESFDKAAFLYGGAGNDILDGGDDGGFYAFGGDGDDQLYGTEADSTSSDLKGGYGADLLVGGIGGDTFVFDDNDGRDQVRRFNVQEDLLDLGAVDADRGQAGDQAFSFIGTAAFTGVGQVRYSGGDVKTVQLNTDADRSAEQEFSVTTALPATLAADDFVL